MRSGELWIKLDGPAVAASSLVPVSRLLEGEAQVVEYPCVRRRQGGGAPQGRDGNIEFP